MIYPAGPADFTFRSCGLPSLRPDNFTPLPDQNFLAPYKLCYTRKGITAAHACLDLATATRPTEAYRDGARTPEDLLRRFGILPHVRIFYALRFLLFVAHEVWRTGRYDLVDIGALRVEAYTRALKVRLKAASSGGKYRAPSLWLYALETRIEPWCMNLYALLQRDEPRGQAEADSEGGATPRPTPNEALRPLPLDGKTIESETRKEDSSNTTCDALTDIPLSPLLLDFPLGLFSTPDRLTDHSSSAISSDGISRRTRGGSVNVTGHSTISNGGIPSTATSTRSTQTTPELFRDPTPILSETSGNVQPDRNDSQAREGHVGDLGYWFGETSTDFDPFTHDWDSLIEALPGSDSLFPTLSPCAPVQTVQHTGVDQGPERGRHI